MGTTRVTQSIRCRNSSNLSAPLDCVQLGGWQVIVSQADQIVSSDVVRVEQVHGTTIVQAREAGNALQKADGIIGSRSDSPLAIVTADCMPLVLMTEEEAVALHVSRKSLVQGLLDRVPEIISPEKIVNTFIGPYICERHFQFEWVGNEIRLFCGKFLAAVLRRGDVLHLSLRQAVQKYFKNWNVNSANIYEDEQCTWAHTENSYRRWLANGKTGRLQQLATVVRALPGK